MRLEDLPATPRKDTGQDELLFEEPIPTMYRLLVLLLAAASSAAGAAGTFVFSNEPGPHPVGVHIKARYDHSRVYLPSFDLVTGQPDTRERARAIQSITPKVLAQPMQGSRDARG